MNVLNELSSTSPLERSYLSDVPVTLALLKSSNSSWEREYKQLLKQMREVQNRVQQEVQQELRKELQKPVQKEIREEGALVEQLRLQVRLREVTKRLSAMYMIRRNHDSDRISHNTSNDGHSEANRFEHEYNHALDDARDDGAMFSRNSGLSVSGGQFNNVSGDQVVNMASANSQFYILDLPQSILTFRFNDNMDRGNVMRILEHTLMWISQRLLQLGSDLDVSQLSQLALLLVYYSFQPQITQFIEGALPQPQPPPLLLR
ncbi:slightly ste11-like protein [Paramarasmius palmivorus]|uniref:Slightly ste11-like protein n=1 Tax=Paramarasmius palmivorus TaxID=297713 RepID=A0AAW0CP69_9AGAR